MIPADTPVGTKVVVDEVFTYLKGQEGSLRGREGVIVRSYRPETESFRVKIYGLDSVFALKPRELILSAEEVTIDLYKLAPDENPSIQDDAVNHPSHYNRSEYKHTECGKSIECWDIVEKMSFNLGNVVKYVWRADSKHKSPLEDLKKAEAYIKREIARIEGEKHA